MTIATCGYTDESHRNDAEGRTAKEYMQYDSVYIGWKLGKMKLYWLEMHP